MASTKVTAAKAMYGLRELIKSKRLATIVFNHASSAANLDITLPLYLDLTFPFPILSITIISTTPKAVNETFGYCLINAAGTSDQCLTTAVGADQAAATEFMIGMTTGANPGNIIQFGDATTVEAVYSITAVWLNL
jgi:hypothetical protein